jgi:hypothetical protein
MTPKIPTIANENNPSYITNKKEYHELEPNFPFDLS